MILFIDEEPKWVEVYQRELRDSGYQVVPATSTDEALSLLSAHQDQVELIILDIMMPAGPALRDANTERGRRTGVFLYRELRRLAPDVPFIILTNVSDPEVEKAFEKEDRCRFIHKYEYLPHEVREIAQSMLQRSVRK